MRTEIEGIKDEQKAVRTEIAEIKDEQKAMRTEIRENREETQRMGTQLMAYIESHVEKEIRLLAEGHQIILDRLTDKERLSELEQRVMTLEYIVKNIHSA